MFWPAGLIFCGGCDSIIGVVWEEDQREPVPQLPSNPPAETQLALWADAA